MRYALLSFFLLLTLSSFAQLAVPELWGMRVHDEAKVLSAQTAQQLESQLKVYEDSTTNQIAILIIPSLEGEAIEDYSIRVAHDTWKLGKSGNDNGVLLLIVVNDRKVRIEVGQGLEGVLTDLISSQIIRNEIAPNFRRGDYDTGVTSAIAAVVQAIGGEYKSDGVVSTAGRKRSINPILVIFLVITGISLISRFFKGGNNRGGGWSSGAGWYGMGGLGGGRSSGGGGGFGGFSGGGGSFGGGGSSGSW